ncbi:MAG: prepilin-type N-terminal cleavage/methylation domain-containing protein [Lysobacteraceae bacterium]|nr:MAG: prepilin-type N-terminal cleavage/methylation domain-containing protein [Xanthomonadaceae bacterium]
MSGTCVGLSGRQRQARQASGRSGLTLLELLFVLAIIAVLALLAATVYARVVERSRVTQAIVEVGDLAVEIERIRSTTFQYPDALPSPRLDPWGRPYVYTRLEGIKGKGKARKDHALNPLNTDFDLFSTGKNGVFKPQVSQKDSLDDIIRARNGGYVGLAGEF